MKPAVFSPLTWFSRTRKTCEPRAPRIGLCLSSGGARGLSHVGVIQVLEEEHIPITAIAGSSMGAYVGSLWAAGFDGHQLEALAREIKDRRTLLRLLDPVLPPSTGLIKGDKIRQHLARSLGTLTFEELKTPFLAVATDLDSLAPVVFDTGNVASAVHASIAIPGVCAPVVFNDRRLTDGGASEPLPVSLMKKRFALEHVIAVSVVPTPKDIVRCNENHPRDLKWSPFRWLNLLAYGNVLDTLRRALMSAQMQVAAKEAARADVLLRPFFCESRWYDFENFDRYIKAGRDAATAALPQIRALLQNQTPPTQGGRHETHRPHPEMGFLAA